MIITTKFFGDADIQDKDIIIFKGGIPGFEDSQKLVLIDMDAQGMFKCLQSLDNTDIAFLMIDPWHVISEYEIEIDDEQLSEFSDKDINNLIVYSIMTVTQDKMTANLMAPIIINARTQQGKQLVLYKSKYTTKHIIKEFEKKAD